jgi:aspartyl-tRNA(Asn)/glutamyl-tRNA(Gln) amidotransferase subunit B
MMGNEGFLRFFYDAGVLTSERPLADYFEALVKETGEAKTASNWVMGELLKLLKENNCAIKDCPVKPQTLAKLIHMVKSGEVNANTAKDVFEEVYKTGKSPHDVVRSIGRTQSSDETELVKKS